MPLASSIVSAASAPVSAEIDARWTMAYAAALGDSIPCYIDTLQPSRFIAHPIFPVCFEWPLIVAMRKMFTGTSLTDAEAMRGVHATHNSIIHRPIRPPERLTTRLQVAGVERRTPGAFQTTRLDTTDASGVPVCTTWYGSIYRGVAVEGPDRPAEVPPAPPAPPNLSESRQKEIKIEVPAGMAHVYTECARIFNPIHTDAAVARAAGLPAIILHGTATLALAVSRIVEAYLHNDPARVERVAGRFAAMVMMPSTLTVRSARFERGVYFEVLNANGERALREGYVGERE
jgi:acyl dehydratase